jgi:hypothetical protein
LVKDVKRNASTNRTVTHIDEFAEFLSINFARLPLRKAAELAYPRLASASLSGCGVVHLEGKITVSNNGDPATLRSRVHGFCRRYANADPGIDREQPHESVNRLDDALGLANHRYRGVQDNDDINHRSLGALDNLG